MPSHGGCVSPASPGCRVFEHLFCSWRKPPWDTGGHLAACRKPPEEEDAFPGRILALCLRHVLVPLREAAPGALTVPGSDGDAEMQGHLGGNVCLCSESA